MAQITVAKALTRLKIINRRINDLIAEISQALPTHSKTCSLIVAERDIQRNHKEARAIIASKLQAIKDLQKYYAALNANIIRSNLDTYITSEFWGPMTVAHALTYCASLQPQFKALDEAVRRAAAQAESITNSYNRMLMPNGVQASNEELKLILAQPVVLADPDKMEEIKRDRDIVVTELNDLINQSNAITNIDLPEGTPDFLVV